MRVEIVIEGIAVDGEEMIWAGERDAWTNRHLEGWSRRRAGWMGEVVDLRMCVVCVRGQGLASLGGHVIRA